METVNPRTPGGMREVTLRSIECCRTQIEMFGNFGQRFALLIGNDTTEFTLSPGAAASSLSGIFEEAHTEAVRRTADVVFLMLNRPMASLNQLRDIEQWESIFVVTQTTQLTVVGMLPFRRTNSGVEFRDLHSGECETDSLGRPQELFENLGYVVDENALGNGKKGRRTRGKLELRHGCNRRCGAKRASRDGGTEGRDDAG